MIVELSLSLAGTLAVPIALLLWFLHMSNYLSLLFKKGVLIRNDKSDAIGKIVKLSHGSTHYYLTGPEHGPLVVFIHGFSVPSQPYIECGMADYYTKSGYRFLTFDLYGRGHSDAPDTKYSPELFVGQLIELLYVLDIKEPFDVVGYSMGGAFAMYFADAYPKLVKKMVFVSSAGVKINIMAGLLKMIKCPILGEAVFKFFCDSFLNPRDELLEPIEDTPISRYSQKQLEHQGLKRSLYSTIKHFKMENLHDLIDRIAASKREVLIIHGDRDYLIPHKSAEYLHSRFSGSKLVTIPGGTHTMLLEHMHPVHTSIVDFL